MTYVIVVYGDTEVPEVMIVTDPNDVIIILGGIIDAASNHALISSHVVVIEANQIGGRQLYPEKKKSDLPIDSSE